MKIRAFITQKIKEEIRDCQDRFSINGETNSIAVSDGMGSTWQQKIWAQLLVDTFTKNPEWVPNKESVKELSPQWRIQVKNFIEDLKAQNAPQNIIIRNENCLAEGRSAGATFVGIRFKGFKWEGDVLGDSCLIEWNGKEAVFHSSQTIDKFDNYPDYFDSNAFKDGKGVPKPIGGNLSKGTKLLLVSDPFSDFLLEHDKKKDIAEYINMLLAISSHDEFVEIVDEWRKAGMHNDDTTLIIVEHDDDTSFNVAHIDCLSEMIEAEKAKQEEEESNETVSESSHHEIEKVKELVPNEKEENVLENSIKSVAEKSPEDEYNCQHAIVGSNSNPVKEENGSLGVTELFINDFISNLQEEIRKDNKYVLISLRLGKQNLTQDEKDQIKNALNRTLKKYNITIKI